MRLHAVLTGGLGHSSFVAPGLHNRGASRANRSKGRDAKPQGLTRPSIHRRTAWQPVAEGTEHFETRALRVVSLLPGYGCDESWGE